MLFSAPYPTYMKSHFSNDAKPPILSLDPFDSSPLKSLNPASAAVSVVRPSLISVVTNYYGVMKLSQNSYRVAWSLEAKSLGQTFWGWGAY